MTELDFTGRVALVTGAGNGLGRAYALFFAARGAKVVVNDLGGNVQGSGSDRRAADVVVDTIRSKGGVAVADYNSVTDGDRVVQTAIDAFGRIDIVVNNAGILRDASFSKMSPEHWDLVNSVHLRGSFLVTRAAWPYMRNQQYGRIIMTSSTSGLFGNFGQANYSAAKMGLVGLANTLAIEGKKYGITCNTIVPTAGSRLSAHVMPQNFADAMKPEYIAPVVLWLCHESCTESKGIFEAGGGWVAAVGLHRTNGVVLQTSAENISPEKVRDNWKTIVNFADAQPVREGKDTIEKLAALMSSPVSPTEPKSELISTFQITAGKVALFNLSLGCNSVEVPSHLKFTYENSSEFCVMPTFAVLPAQEALSTFLASHKEFRFNPTNLLHGEQTVILHARLPTEGKLLSQVSFSALSEKKNAIVAKLHVDSRSTDGTLIVTNIFTLFIRDAEYPPSLAKAISSSNQLQHELPSHPANQDPELTFKETIPTSSAAIYRLNGDLNPLHIDPGFAKAAGFRTPILHGLCTMGLATKRIVLELLNEDPHRVASVHCRFAAPVFPGDTLLTKVWKLPRGYWFECNVEGRNDKVLTNGWLEVRATPVSQSASTQERSSTPVDATFDEMQQNITPSLIEQTNAVFRFKLKDGVEDKVFLVDLKKEGKIRFGDSTTKADTTISMDGKDFLALVDGKLQPMQAFMKGKLKISGNMMLAQKLQAIFKSNKQATESNSNSSASPAEKVFQQLSTSITPELTKQINATFRFRLQEHGRENVYVIDLKQGKVLFGDTKTAADTTISMSVQDFFSLKDGSLNAMQAFMKGKLKITGNMMLAQKLQDLFKTLRTPSKL